MPCRSATTLTGMLGTLSRNSRYAATKLPSICTRACSPGHQSWKSAAKAHLEQCFSPNDHQASALGIQKCRHSLANALQELSVPIAAMEHNCRWTSPTARERMLGNAPKAVSTQQMPGQSVSCHAGALCAHSSGEARWQVEDA